MDVTKVLPELDHYDLSDDIKHKAREIYISMTSKNRRGKSRKRYIFYCIYHAYLDMGFMIDQEEVATKIGLDPKEISASKNLSPDRGMYYQPAKIIFRTVKECLDSYYDDFFTDRSLYEEVESLAQGIVAKAMYLEERYPHVTAAVILCIFAESKGCIIDRNLLASRLHCRKSIVTSIYKTIYDIYCDFA